MTAVAGVFTLGLMLIYRRDKRPEVAADLMWMSLATAAICLFEHNWLGVTCWLLTASEWLLAWRRRTPR